MAWDRKVSQSWQFLALFLFVQIFKNFDWKSALVSRIFSLKTDQNAEALRKILFYIDWASLSS
jgi:hypothetical protein